MDHQNLIETIDHRVRLWIELLSYADQEIEVKDQGSNVEVNIRPHHDRTVVSIPTIAVRFVNVELPLNQLAAVALDLINQLAESALNDFTDYQVSIDFDAVDQSFTINFNSYGIKKG